jgi:rare lipoprotein A
MFLVLFLLVNCQHTLKGKASWYGNEYQGRRTASGEVFDERSLTAAHKKLSFGTVVRVKNLENGRTVVVRINDRGPFKRGRVIDLSKAAARELGMIDEGIVKVRLKVLKKARKHAANDGAAVGESGYGWLCANGHAAVVCADASTKNGD